MIVSSNTFQRIVSFMKSNLVFRHLQHWVCYSTTCKSILSIVWWNQVHVRNFLWSKQSVWHSGSQNSKKNLELYGIKGCNLRWFESYLSNRKQFITYGDKQTNIETITCGVPQGSILGSLLFLIFVNDLHKVTKYLDPIMFADDTKLFYSHKNIKTLF